jgi:hypothetical protein
MLTEHKAYCPENSTQPFNILASLLHHGNGELFNCVAKLVAAARTTEVNMVFGQPNVTSKDKFVDVASYREFEGSPGATPMSMKQDHVSLYGTVLKGVLYLTKPANNPQTVQLTESGCVPIDIFPEVDCTMSDGRRWYNTYLGFLKRGVVFMRNVDGGISVIVSTRTKYGPLQDSTRLALQQGDISCTQFHELLRAIEMPVQDASTYLHASKRSLVVENISKEIVLKTTIYTYGMFPLAFRLNQMGFARPVNYPEVKEDWALLVPRAWMHGNSNSIPVDPSVYVPRVKLATNMLSVRKIFNKSFQELGSVIVDYLCHSNTTPIGNDMPVDEHRESLLQKGIQPTKVGPNPKGRV